MIILTYRTHITRLIQPTQKAARLISDVMCKSMYRIYPNMKIKTKRLNIVEIENSSEIKDWLNQFSPLDVSVAKSLLCRLEFISRDDYSKWLLNKLKNYTNKNSCAVYAVRKFNKDIKCLWDNNGKVQLRPAQTQGSEDLVASIISNFNRQNNNFFIDHPPLDILRKNKIRHIVLIDDSIGSGQRISNFIQLMTSSKTFLSWWSGGFLTIHILSYARTRQSEQVIKKRIPGSDHGKRKYRLSHKLKFDSTIVYDAFDLHNRWGNQSQAILSLCNSNSKISKKWRKGFGDVMGNLVFYHSVPNNIPGVLFYRSKSWKPLFPNRSLPSWLIKLLENTQSTSHQIKREAKLSIGNEIIKLLQNIKSGVRTKTSLSRRMDCDISIINDLICKSKKLGFITERFRLTKSGCDLLFQKKQDSYKIIPNYSLYIPQSWCVDQGTVQPPVDDALQAHQQADSIDSSSMDGDDGEPSLERTDATATSSPMRDVTKYPSWARDRHIPHGPTG